MANYDVGTLLLDLQVYGQAEFEQNMGRIEQGIEDADAAGQSFFRNNKSGYGALKSLVVSAAESVEKLTQSYDEGRISSSEYAEGLAVIDRINTAASRSSGTLKKSVVDVSAALASVRQAGDSYEAVFNRAIGQTERLFASLAAGRVSTNDAARALSDARREVIEFSSSLDESSDEAQQTFTLAVALGRAMTDLANGTPNDGLVNQLRGIREEALGARQALAPLESISLDEPEIDLAALERAGELHEDELELLEQKIRREREYRAELEETNAARDDRNADPFRDEPAYAPPATPPSGGGNRPVTGGRRGREQDAEFMNLERQFTIFQGLQRAGEITTSELTASMADLRQEALSLAAALGEDNERYARFIELAGRAGLVELKPGMDWDEKAVEDKIKGYENSLKTLEARYQKGELDAAQYRKALRELATEAGVTASAFEEATNERTRLEGVAGRATKVAFTLDTDDLDAEIRTVENRFKSLTGLFDAGELSAQEYGAQLQMLARDALAAAGAFDEATAERARLEAVAGRATKTVLTIDTQASQDGIKSLEGRLRGLTGLFNAGELTVDDYRAALAMLKAEALQTAEAVEDVALAGRAQAVAGTSGREVTRLDESDTEQKIREIENALKRASAEFAQDGNIERYRAALASIGDEAKRAGEAFDGTGNEATRLSAVAGRAAEALSRLNADRVADSYAELNTRVAQAEQGFAKGRLSLAQYREVLESVARAAREAAEATDDVQTASRFEGLAARAVKLQDTRSPDRSVGSVDNDMVEYERRLMVIDNLHRADQLSSREFRQELDKLGAEALESASRFDRLSDEYARYVSVAGRAAAITQRLDQASLRDSFFSKQFILGNALSNIYGELGIRLIDFAANGIASMDNLAVASERAIDGTARLNRTVAETGTSYAQVRADLDATAAKYFILASNAEGAATTLLEAGYSSEQVAQLLDAVGATAVQRGQDVREAFAEIAAGGDDIEGALTTATGATEAYDRALLRAAAGQQNMVGNLARTDRQAALVASVMGSASDALRDYGMNTDGVVGAQMRQAAAAELFRRELGEKLGPAIIDVTDLGTKFIRMATGMVTPIVDAGEAVARFVSHFDLLDTVLISMAVGGPKAAAGLGKIFQTLTTSGTSVAAVVGMLGGWPAILAALGIGAVAAGAYFLDLRSDSEKLATALTELEQAGEVGASAFEQLKTASDEEGVKGAVEALAATMRGDAKTAFEEFATSAIETADTTIEAVDKIFSYVAQQRAQLTEDALVMVRRQIELLEQEDAAVSDYAQSDEGVRLVAALQQQNTLMERQAYLQDLIKTGSSEERARALGELTVLRERLAAVSSEVNILGQQTPFAGGAAAVAQESERVTRLEELYAEESRLQQDLLDLRNRPTETILGTRPQDGAGGQGGSDDGDGGPVEDPLQDFRDGLNVARAEYNNLKTLMETGVGDVGFSEVSAGAQGLLGSLDTIIGKMQALNGAGQLAADQQVELYNLAGERARLVAEINESPNVQRESEAGAWIERLAVDAERGAVSFAGAMSELRKAQDNLQGEMGQFEDLSVMTPEQEARYAMLIRLTEMVEDAQTSLQDRMTELGATDVMAGLTSSMRDFIAQQERIPERVLVKFEEAGGDRSFYDDYNARFEELDEQQREFLATQAELANWDTNLPRAELLGGMELDPAVERANALRTALEAVYGLDPDTPGLERRVRLWEQELAALDGAIVREQNLADAAAETARQRQAAAGSRAAADVAYTQTGEDGGTQLEQQAARVAQLRSDLREVGENSIAGQLIAADLGVTFWAFFAKEIAQTWEDQQRCWCGALVRHLGG